MAGDQPVSCKSFTMTDLLMLGVLVPVSFLLPFMLGRNGFLLFDFSLVLDAGWRILNGQLPHVDFILPSGPGCFVLQALFFKMCGPNLYAPLVHVGVINALAALLVYLIIKRKSNTALALVAGLATAAWFYTPYPFPWYDTTAFFFVLLAQAVYGLLSERETGTAKTGSLILGALVGAAFLSKQNIGLFALILYAALLWHSAGIRRPGRALLLGAGFLGVVGGYLLFNTMMGGGTGTIEGLFVRPALMGRGGKILAARTWLNAFRSWPIRLLAAIFVLMLIHANWRRPRLERLRLSADITGLTGLCLLAALTGTAPKYIFLPFMGLCAGLFTARFVLNAGPGDQGAGNLRTLKSRFLMGLLILFIVWGGWVGASRVAKTYALRRSGFQTSYALADDALKPFTMDEKLGRAVDHVLLELKMRNAAEEGLYVFPNATILYLALGFVSPIPYVWLHPGQSFFQKALDDEKRLVHALDDLAPRWVVMWDDYQFNFDRSELIYFMPQLKKYFEDQYTLDLETPVYRILIRK